jgi:hypothetical protein
MRNYDDFEVVKEKERKVFGGSTSDDMSFGKPSFSRT